MVDLLGLNSQGRRMVEPFPAMTVRDVATCLNVNEKTVYRLAHRRALPAFKLAGAWRFKREDIDLWIERQKATDATGGRRR